TGCRDGLVHSLAAGHRSVAGKEVAVTTVSGNDAVRTAGHRYRSSTGLRLARAAAQGNGRAKVRAVNGKLHSPGWGPAARRVCRHRRGKGNRLSEGRWVHRT